MEVGDLAAGRQNARHVGAICFAEFQPIWKSQETERPLKFKLDSVQLLSSFCLKREFTHQKEVKQSVLTYASDKIMNSLTTETLTGVL
jgi:hypothetical protein